MSGTCPSDKLGFLLGVTKCKGGKGYRSIPRYPSPRGMRLVENFSQFEREKIRDFQVRSAYSDYLQSQHWDYFITVTFRSNWRDSIKAHEAVWDRLHFDCFAERAFLAVERHHYPNWNCHVHGLVSGYSGDWKPEMLLPWKMWEKLFRAFGRTSVEEVKSPEDVSAYCSKYVIKKMSDYGFYGAATLWGESKMPRF